MKKVTASLEVIGVQRGGERFPIVISIGVPYEEAGSAGRVRWACPVAIEGLYSRLADMVGENSLQALCLAIYLVRLLLQGFIEDGGRLLLHSGEDFPLDAYFPATPPTLPGTTRTTE